MTHIETYMNNATVKTELGVNPEVKFKSCNGEVNKGSSLHIGGFHQN
jgi:hypothetical protein